MRLASSAKRSPTFSVFARISRMKFSARACCAESPPFVAVETGALSSERADDKFRRGADGIRLTSVVEQIGQATSLRDNWDSNSSVEANQPSNRWSSEHFKSRTFMLIGACQKV